MGPAWGSQWDWTPLQEGLHTIHTEILTSAEAVNVTYGQVDPQQDRNQFHKTVSLLCVLMPREPLKEGKKKSSPLKKSKKTKSPQAIRLAVLEGGSGWDLRLKF